jgi:tRNA dimethylallyltransferase
VTEVVDRRARPRGALPERRQVIVVCGATATGKSDLAVALAEALRGEVVGADSRQVYRYLDVGTAKPSADLRARARHHGIDVVDPDRDFSVADWRRMAIGAIDDIAGRGNVAIVCGGTGLYLRSLLRGLCSGPAADSALRRALLAQEAERPGSLHGRLARIDPHTAARVHPNDLVRTVRALEVYELTARPLSSFHRDHSAAEPAFDALVLEVGRPRDELRRRIAERARSMVAAGLVDEVKALSVRFDLELKAFSAIGYREARECLRGRIPLGELPQAIASATRAYAKRQRVWLRGQMDTVEVDADRTGHSIAVARGFLASVATRQGIG